MNKSFKVSFATNDGIITFSHLGSTKCFEVFEIKGGKAHSRERREQNIDDTLNELLADNLVNHIKKTY
ncbi:MAG: hypothetical protein ACK4R9_10460 [Ignavibacterium sp.]